MSNFRICLWKDWITRIQSFQFQVQYLPFQTQDFFYNPRTSLALYVFLSLPKEHPVNSGCPPVYHPIRSCYKNRSKKDSKNRFSPWSAWFIQVVKYQIWLKTFDMYFIQGNLPSEFPRCFFCHPYEQTIKFTVPLCFDFVFRISYFIASSWGEFDEWIPVPTCSSSGALIIFFPVCEVSVWAGNHKFSFPMMSGSFKSMFCVLHRLDLGLRQCLGQNSVFINNP